MGEDANGWFDGVGAHLDQNRIQLDNLFTRHALYLACVGDAAEQRTAVRISERRDLIRQIVAPRIPWAAADELDLLEFPAAVLTKAELASDFSFAVGHRSPPNPSASKLTLMTASSVAPSVCCSRSWAASRAIVASKSSPSPSCASTPNPRKPGLKRLDAPLTVYLRTMVRIAG